MEARRGWGACEALEGGGEDQTIYMYEIFKKIFLK